MIVSNCFRSAVEGLDGAGAQALSIVRIKIATGKLQASKRGLNFIGFNASRDDLSQ
jgi:hypothetical protein